MNKLNENIFHQYNKWKTGYMRKENRMFTYNTDFGKIRLKGIHDEEEVNTAICDIIDCEKENDQYLYEYIKFYDFDTVNRIKKDEEPYIYLISDKYDFLCLDFMRYDKLADCYYKDEWSEDEYIAMIKFISLYIRNNVELIRNRNNNRFLLSLYCGVPDVEENGIEDFLFLMNGDFGNNFDYNNFSWWIEEDITYIGIEIDSYTLKKYSEMKRWIENKNI